jgi:hypothetical protein
VLLFIAHLCPIDGHGPNENVRVQLSVFYLAIVFGKTLAWHGLCLALAAFIPTYPPALDIVSFVDPNLSHNIESIVTIGVQIKRKNGARIKQYRVFLETCAAVSFLCPL